MDVALESSVWVTSPEFAGWLTKRGFHWRKLWKKRWVALHGAEIVYMDKEPTMENSSTLTMTKSQISSATVIDRDDIDGNPNGFAVHINDGHSPTWYLRAESSREKKSWLMRLAHVHTIVRWLEDFEKVRVLGVGGTGIVYELLHKTNGQRYAMKEMEIKNKAQMEMAVQEAEMLKDIMENISHPNIMHIEKVFQVGSKFYLVFPLCVGGELYEHIIRRGNFTEHDAALLTRDLISGLHALHSRDILHLDIKPENLLFDSAEPSARIKITDFGLSRMFNNTGNEEEEMPSPEELEEKLQDFLESGILNRDRLRGTIGYMSPELILCGHSSRATDVFAAGVVLYILLCGYPPFHSKSNREVLEKTARGTFRMDGPQWGEVSEEAKDLVRRMLDPNPRQRITTKDILAHPWLQNLAEELPPSTTPSPSPPTPTKSSPSTTTPPPPPTTSPHANRKGTGGNLSGALRLLSGHVSHMKTEKFASTFTRLVSSLKNGGKGKASMLKQLLRTADGQPLPPDTSEDEESMLLMYPDIRDALSSVIESLGEEPGKLSLDQFASILFHFLSDDGLSAGSGAGVGTGADSEKKPFSLADRINPSTGHGLVMMLLCRFMDRDGDGFISGDDIFTSQALISQRSDPFIRVVFRIYSEAVWYPGRQLNLLHLQRNSKKTPAGPSLSSKNVLDSGDTTAGAGDVVEPPKFITGRHVAVIFEKLGYDPQSGLRIFSYLCEAVNKLGQTEGHQWAMGLGSSTKEPSSPTPVPAPLPPVSEPGREEEDSLYTLPNINSLNIGPPPVRTTSNDPKAPNPNAALAAALGSPSPSDPNPIPLVHPVSPLPEGPQKRGFFGMGMAGRLAGTGTASGASGESEATGVSVNSKMDVNDFIKAVQIDDILITVLLRKGRMRVVDLIRKAESGAREGAEEDTSSDMGDKSKSYSSLLEAQLVQALGSSNP